MQSKRFVLLILGIVGSCYAIDAGLESFVRGSNDDSPSLAQESSATNAIPSYSDASANQVGSEIGNLDDEELKRRSEAKLEAARRSKGTDVSPEIITVKSSERKEIDNFERHEMFKKAEKIYQDPVSLLKEITETECVEKINEGKNHYTKHIIHEEKTELDYEEKTCEKPTDNVTCERTLDVKCEATKECESGGIELGSVETGMEWEYQYPTIRFGSKEGSWRFICPGQACCCQKEVMKAKFKVRDKDEIRTFLLKKIAFDDHAMIHVNGHLVYNSWGGHKLEFSAGKFCKDTWVDAGDGKGGNCFQWLGVSHSRQVSIDLRPYLLADKENEIVMTLVFAQFGQFNIEIEARQQCCTKIADKWETRCWQS